MADDSIKTAYDFIIIGGGLSGLVAANTLSKSGHSCLILEKTPFLGGGNKSRKTGCGHIFDSGYHALDLHRSKLTTDFFFEVMKGDYFTHELQRGIVLEDYVLPYNSSIETWPHSLQRLCSLNDADIVGNTINTDLLSKSYGSLFIDYIVSNVVDSYPSLTWNIEKSGSLEAGLGYVYPWFFPSLVRDNIPSEESSSFHGKMRTQNTQEIVYPKSNGFYGFIKKIAQSLSPNVDVVTSCFDKGVEFFFQADTAVLQSVKFQGNRISFGTALWCAPIPAFLGMMGRDLTGLGIPQKLVLGNFILSRELPQRWHELLVGSRNHKINRIGFTGRLQCRTNRQLQVEYYFPDTSFNLTEQEWRESWETSLTALGLIGHPKDVEAFEFQSHYRGFVSNQKTKTTTRYILDEVEKLDTNLVFPYKIIGPENMNRIIEGVIRTCGDFI